MVLTQQQENIINKYLAEVNNYLNPINNIEKRKQLLFDLKKKIFSTLQKRGKNYITDEELYQVLSDEFDDPGLQAERLLNPRDPSQKLTLNFEDRVWLGVCAGLAVRTKLPVILVRFLFALLGMCLGIGFIIYLSLYFFLYFSSGIYRGKTIRWSFFIYQLVLTLFLIICIYISAYLCLRGIEYSYTRWVSTSNGSLIGVERVYPFLFLTFIIFMWTGILSAIMGGLPLRNDWDKTFRNIRDAQIALLVIFQLAGTGYAIYLFIINSISVLRNLMV